MKDPFRNFNTYKIDPLSEIRNAGIVTNGSVYWVSSVSDSLHTSRRNDMGRADVKETLQQAIDAVRSDNNDYVLVVPTDGGTARKLGTAVDINEDRVHVLGLSSAPAPYAYDGLTFEGYVVANGVDTELVAVSGAAVELGNLKFLGTSGTHANGTITSHLLIGTASTGTPHNFWAHDLHVENTQAAADNGTADIVKVVGAVAATGIKGLRFDRCWLGNRYWAPAAVVTMAGGTAGPSRSEFHDCKFVIDAQATSDKIIVLGTGETEYTLFENCQFINVEAGTLLASAITGAVLVDNPVLLSNSHGLNITAMGTDTEVFASPQQAGTSGAGVHNSGLYLVGTSGVVAA